MSAFRLYGRFILALLICGMISSCKNKRVEVKESLYATINYADGTPHRKIYIIDNDTARRKIITFYKNGTTEEEYFLQNCHRHGKHLKYYSNGKLALSGSWEDGKRSGLFNYYDSLGSLEFAREFILLDQEEKGYYLNRVYKFTNTGDTIKKQSCYFSITAPDTIIWGQDYDLKLFIDAPIYERAGFVICNFDPKFNRSPSEMCDSTLMENFKGEYITRKYHQGDNVIRGAIFNYNVIIDSEGNGITRGHMFFFEKKYFVNLELKK